MLTSFHAGTFEYYELFARTAVEYLPHPYPIDWVEQHEIFVPRVRKERALLKAGYIHGRIGSDGL